MLCSPFQFLINCSLQSPIFSLQTEESGIDTSNGEQGTNPATKKISLDQYRSKHVSRPSPALLLQQNRFVQQQQQHHQITPRELLLNNKNKQVLYVMNSNCGRDNSIGNSVSSQHQVLKLQHEQLQSPQQQQCDTPDSTTSLNAADNEEQGPRFRPGHQVVCGNCGILGDDFNVCQRCKKPLAKNARIIANVPSGVVTSSGAVFQTGSALIKQVLLE